MSSYIHEYNVRHTPSPHQKIDTPHVRIIIGKPNLVETVKVQS